MLAMLLWEPDYSLNFYIPWNVEGRGSQDGGWQAVMKQWRGHMARHWKSNSQKMCFTNWSPLQPDSKAPLSKNCFQLCVAYNLAWNDMMNDVCEPLKSFLKNPLKLFINLSSSISFYEKNLAIAWWTTMWMDFDIRTRVYGPSIKIGISVKSTSDITTVDRSKTVSSTFFYQNSHEKQNGCKAFNKRGHFFSDMDLVCGLLA